MSSNLKITGDNSPTLFSERFQAHYHSIHGAWTETDIVFIESGLNLVSKKKNNISILEIGYGSGINCLATSINAKYNDLTVHYFAVEKYPVAFDLIKPFGIELLQYISHDDLENFYKMHDSNWNEKIEIITNFFLNKIQIDFFDINLDRKVDLIYFDAFAPETQPELWTIDMFELMANCLEIGGVLNTYCAKGYVKRNLKAAGFSVEALPGPPGKREITRATKL